MMFRFDSQSLVNVCRSSVLRGILAPTLLLLIASPATTATIAYWQFEPGNLTADSSGNGNVLSNTGVTSSGDTSSVAPGSGSASFDGTHTQFSTTSTLDLSSQTQITIEWFMKTSQATIPLLFEHSPDQNNIANAGAFTGQINPGFGVAGGAGFTNRVTDGYYRDATSAVSGGLNTWHHYAVHVDSSINNVGANDRVKVFVDGVLDTTDNDSGVPTATNAFLDDFLFIGSRNNTSAKYVGLLDEFRISSGLLDPTEFLNFQPPVPEPSTGLLAVIGLGLLNSRRRRIRGKTARA